MVTYLERYRDGEHEEVWAELVGLGERVRDEPLLSDAYAVARETMRRARRNVETILPRLESIGYRLGILWSPLSLDAKGRYVYGEQPYWKDLTPAFVPSSPGTRDVLKKIEQVGGTFPLSLRAWWEEVGEVNLCGYHPDWSERSGCDPLLVCTSDLSLLEGEGEEYSFFPAIDDGLDKGTEADLAFAIENGLLRVVVAPDELHKENVSGGDPYTIRVPCAVADRRLDNFWLDVTFVEYLRLCFRWGGFPGFARLRAHERDKMPREHLDLLTRDLLPL